MTKTSITLCLAILGMAVSISNAQSYGWTYGSGYGTAPYYVSPQFTAPTYYPVVYCPEEVIWCGPEEACCEPCYECVEQKATTPRAVTCAPGEIQNLRDRVRGLEVRVDILEGKKGNPSPTPVTTKKEK